MSLGRLLASLPLVALGGVGAASTSMAVEQVEYRVEIRDGAFELRRHAPRIVAETTVEGDFESVGNEGFRRLLAYIRGSNRASTQVAMTAPVGQEPASRQIAMTAPVGQERAGERYRITFVMPSEYELESLPEPVDPRVRLRAEPERWTASIRYRGTWSEDRYRDHQARLRTWLAVVGLEPTGEPPVWARYDPPFMPWFLRRNEVWIPVAAPR